MTKGLIAVDLIFPPVVHFFGPRPCDKYSTYPRRQKVRGKLRIVTSKAIKFQHVEIRLKGHTEVCWRDPLRSQSSILAEKLYAYKTLRKSKSTLLDDATLPAGVTELGFEVSLPGYLCATYESDLCEIRYMLMARLIPAAKFSKETGITKEIKIQKTLMPKDVASGHVVGFRVPRLSMRGARPGCLKWEFRVPRWVCLEDGVLAFDGLLRSCSPLAPIQIDKVQVDVVQEEIYRDEMPESNYSKRQLLVCHHVPSTYLHPPLDTSITFSFPLSLHSSEPTGHHPATKIASASGDTITFLKRGRLTYSFESPYHDIHHYIRMIIYPTSNQPICLGLPIRITRRLNTADMEPLPSGDDLPSYHSITRDIEQLPDYRVVDDNDDDEQNDDEEDPMAFAFGQDEGGDLVNELEGVQNYVFAQGFVSSSGSSTQRAADDEVDMGDMRSSWHHWQPVGRRERQHTLSSVQERPPFELPSQHTVVAMRSPSSDEARTERNSSSSGSCSRSSKKTAIIVKERSLSDFAAT